MVSEQIRDIWSRELKLETVADDADFFAVGGHSLIMARIQAVIKAEIGAEIPMDQLMRYSTVAQISEHLKNTMAKSS